MTVNSTTTSVSYTGDNSTVAFPVTFAFFGTTTTAELEVVERTIATGAEVTKVNVTDYTVSGGNNATGTVTAVSAPADTVEWHIRRTTTETQATDYVENDAFPADTHESALDRLTMINQEATEELSRTAQFPVTYTGGASAQLPEPEANKALVWNAGATALENSDSDPDAAAAAAAASAAAAATSESNAATSETNAATSESNASTSASNASTSASNASTSETNAAASAAAAAASAAGIYWKEPVVNATTANITLSGEQTIDGVLTSTSRILVKDQTASEENGVYVTAAGAWSRATPLDTWDEHVGAAVIVSQGTANADTSWICTVDAGGTLDTTAITWAQMSAVYTSATTSSEGIIELATQAEVDAGTDTSRAVTPDTLANYSGLSGAVTLSAITTFTSSGTWTKPANFSYALVYVTGAGGGGGGSSGTANRVGSGGGAGGTAIERFSDGDLSATETVTIGSAGAAGTATTSGGAGGSTSFGALCSATGGGGGGVGGSGSASGTGGSGSGGDLNLDGGDGEVGGNGGQGASSGGASYWGGGGGSTFGSAAGNAGKAYGSGGGGGCYDGSQQAGGAGKVGVVVVYEYTTS